MGDWIAKQHKFSHFSGGNAGYIESLYEQWLDDPDSVSTDWAQRFSELTGDVTDRPHQPVIEQFRKLSLRPATGGSSSDMSPEMAEKQANVLKMVNAYRVRGHQKATLDPLSLKDRPHVADLDPGFHNLGSADMSQMFNTGSLVAPDQMTLKDIHALLENVYCRNIGSEIMHINDTNQRRWLQQRLEGSGGERQYNDAEQKNILHHLTCADSLERYLHTKYVGQKRFSLEGGDTLIPLMHGLIHRAGEQGTKEIVIGMAHRGRINMLVNIMGKSAAQLFEEFEGNPDNNDPAQSGDVKYHLGFSSEVETKGGNVHIALGFNPSHLEIIDPVVVGSARARLARLQSETYSEVLPVLIHGDAAFAGQGVVMELFNMSQARGFQVGGTVHIIVNNQVGFTTSNPVDSRSTLYCTEVAKMVQAPIFHVNGDDPEAVMFAMEIAHDFRQKFHKDVVIDLVCYRRHGHNEADEPSATQPVMYQAIKGRDSVRAMYAKRLLDRGTISEKDAKAMVDDYRDAMDEGAVVADVVPRESQTEITVDWSPYKGIEWTHDADTSLSADKAKQLADTLLDLPEEFTLHSRVKSIYDARRKMADGDQPMDWGYAETLAYASLLEEGYALRLVGQDSGRGTFFHRHSVVYDQKTGNSHIPLEKFEQHKDDVTIIDSLLSEEAVLGFEYGFASSDPKTLVIWEAQFGDFVNGAQVVIDQFISSGETKWGRLCGLVMFLPHGYEGQGPEHSSARLERFMQLCALNNMQVCVPTTPAQMFHMLRRQMKRPLRKPLIVLTPKSLLRNKASVSSLDVLQNSNFQVVIPDRKAQPEKVKRIILCAGKVYYDLDQQRDKDDVEDVAIIRVEQLYPFPREALATAIAQYPHQVEVVWCQEEPMNQGAWFQIKHHLQSVVDSDKDLIYVGRQRSASPAVGFYRIHIQQQQALVKEALTLGQGTPLITE